MQENHEHKNQQTEGNTRCAHKSDPCLASAAPNGMVDRSLAEKPKVGELQMDWPRSEDLKEEKDVTAPTSIVAGQGPNALHSAPALRGIRNVGFKDCRKSSAR